MRYLVSAAMVLWFLGCGGGNLEDDLRVGLPDGVSGIDVPAYVDDVAVANDPAEDREEPVDGTVPGDPGNNADPGEPVDPGVGQDPGTGNDPGAPFDPGVIPDYGDAVGGCDPCGYGTIAGMTCAPNTKAGMPYVRVWVTTTDCDNNPVTIQTYSDAQGNYRLENVPCGTQTVSMQKGSFEHQFVRYVDKGMTTVATSGDACLPGNGLRIAVITGEWDKIETVLRQLWFQYKWFDGEVGEGSGKSEGAKLLSGGEAKDGYPNDGVGPYSLLDDFDVLFINCGPSHATIMQNWGSEISPVLRDFVAQGGSVYASDYASVYVSTTWPVAWSGSFVQDFPGGSTTPREVVASIVDPELAAYMQKQSAVIEYRLGPLTSILGTPGHGTKVHLEGPNSAYGNAIQPFMFSFQPNGIDGGRVIYTNFHNEEQVLDPNQLSDMAEVLQYIVFLM